MKSEPDVEGMGGTRALARTDKGNAGVVGKGNRRRRWIMTVAVLCWWLVLAGVSPEGMTVGAQIRGRFTVLPQILRIAEEDPAGGQYRVTLSREPAEDVTVTVEGIAGTDLTVQPSSLTFTPENWADERTVTVTAAADSDGRLDQVQVRHTATGGGFENSFVPGLLVVVADNDSRGLDLNPTAVTVREEDAKGAAYTVALKTAPKEAVTVAVDGAAGTDLVLGRTALTFDSTDWNVPQTVTVAARGDVDALNEEVKLVHRANGSYLFGATVEVLVTVLDDDEPSTAVEIRTDTASVEEGGGARTVTVTAAYDGAAMIRDVGLRIDVGSGTADRLFDFAPVDSFILTIPAGEGSASGTFTLTPVADDLHEDDETLTIGGVVFSPPGGLGLSVEAASVTITDDDTRGVVIGASAFTLEQGDGATYTIGLASRPTEDVTVEVVAPADGALLVRDRSIVFGAPHWDTPREVRLYAKNDGTPVPDGPVILTHRVSGGDYEGTTAGSVAVTIVERVLPTITVEDTRGVEGSDSLEFAISLDAESIRQVTVSYRTYSPLNGAGVNDAVHLSDYRGSSGHVTFSPGETRKHVRVELIDDELNEAEESFEFNLSNPQNVRLPDDSSVLRVKGIIVDDDPLPTVILELSDYAIGERGGVTSVTANLDYRSSVDTTVEVSATPVAPATASDFVLSADRTLTIRAGNRFSTGTVTITGVDDFIHARGKTVTVEGVAANIAGVQGPFELLLIIEEDDTASLTVDPASLEVVEGTSAHYTVGLTSQPTGTVTVSVEGGAHTEISVDKPSLEFTPENWSTAQTVTVTAGVDADSVDDHDILVHSAAGGGYDNVDQALVEVTVPDSNVAMVTIAAGVEQVIYNLPRDVFDLDDAGFTLTRTGPTDAALEVAVNLTQDQPFLPADGLSRTVTIAAGVTSAKLEIMPSELTGSAAADGTLTATVAEGGRYEVGAEASDSVAMRFVDTAITVGIEKSAYRFPEDQGTGELAVVAETAPGVPAPTEPWSFYVSLSTPSRRGDVPRGLRRGFRDARNSRGMDRDGCPFHGQKSFGPAGYSRRCRPGAE